MLRREFLIPPATDLEILRHKKQELKDIEWWRMEFLSGDPPGLTAEEAERRKARMDAIAGRLKQGWLELEEKRKLRREGGSSDGPSSELTDYIAERLRQIWTESELRRLDILGGSADGPSFELTARASEPIAAAPGLAKRQRKEEAVSKAQMDQIAEKQRQIELELEGKKKAHKGTSLANIKRCQSI